MRNSSPMSNSSDESEKDDSGINIGRSHNL